MYLCIYTYIYIYIERERERETCVFYTCGCLYIYIYIYIERERERERERDTCVIYMCIYIIYSVFYSLLCYFVLYIEHIYTTNDIQCYLFFGEISQRIRIKYSVLSYPSFIFAGKKRIQLNSLALYSDDIHIHV